MKYTGIRAVPFVTPRRIMQPHLARYAFAAQMAGAAGLALDVACGTGYGVPILNAGGCRSVVGVDLDDEAVCYSRMHYAEAGQNRFVKADACALPFENNSLDLVTSFETFEHILHVDCFLAELHRVLKPGGLLIISTPHAPMFEPFTKPPDLKREYIFTGLGHKHAFSAAAFSAALGRHFQDITLHGQDFRPATTLSRVIRFGERLLVGARYRWARLSLERGWTHGFLGDVLPQDDLAELDARWEVRQWNDPKMEPIFCVAVCRVKKS